MGDRLRLLATFFYLNIKKMCAYRKDFMIGLLVSFINIGLDLLFLKVVYRHVDTIEGWTQWQLVFLYGIVTVNLAIYQMLYGNLRSLKAYLFSGEMERILWQPCCPLFAVRFRAFSVAPVNRLLLGIGILMVYGRGYVNWAEFGYAFIFSGIGISTLASIMTLASAVLFYTHYLYTPYDKVSEILKYIHYPMTIFPPVVMKVLTLALPFAFLGYLPAKVLIFSHWQPLLLLYGFAFAILLKLISKYIFRKAIDRFEGSNV